MPDKAPSDHAKLRQHFTFLSRTLDLRQARVLDVGCGSGHFLDVCRDEGLADLSGIENHPTARAQCQARGHTVYSEVSELPPREFDLIYMNDVIEHLRTPWSDCAQLRERLSPAGSLFVITMNVDSLKARLLRCSWDLMRDPTHLFFFNERSLRRTLAAAGFEDPRAEHFPVTFSHHGTLRRGLQEVLVRTRLDSSIKMLARKTLQR